MRPRALLIGAGIHGLCTAWQLLTAGWQVTLVDRAAIPNRAGASYDAHRLIHPMGARDAADCDRIDRAFAAWAQIWAALGRTEYRETGALCGRWPAGGEALMAALDRPEWGLRTLPPGRVAERLPGLRWHPPGPLPLVARAGVLRADRIVERLAALLAERGAALVERAHTTRIEPAGGRVTLHDGRVLAGDVVIVAAGADTAALLPALADRLRIVRQTLAYYRPGTANARWRDAPLLLDFGASGDLWAAPPIAGTPLKFAADGLAVPRAEAGAATMGARLRERVEGSFDTAGWRLLRVAQADYGFSASGAPIVEPLAGSGGRVLLVAGCNGAGFKVAPLVAERLARMAAGVPQAAA